MKTILLAACLTLVAAEATGRICCGLELDPRYVDVIVLRWEALSGKKAVLADVGLSFEEVSRTRAEVSE